MQLAYRATDALPPAKYVMTPSLMTAVPSKVYLTIEVPCAVAVSASRLMPPIVRHQPGAVALGAVATPAVTVTVPVFEDFTLLACPPKTKPFTGVVSANAVQRAPVATAVNGKAIKPSE